MTTNETTTVRSDVAAAGDDPISVRTFNHDLVWSARSNVYHAQSCGSAEAIRDRNRRFGPAAEAVGCGRRPCKVCKPPTPDTAGAGEGAGHGD